MQRRLRVTVRGAVQGVGFRPFVYRLATESDLAGWVVNDTAGVVIEVEGDEQRLERFVERLESERPAISWIESSSRRWLDTRGVRGFHIRHSETAGVRTVQVLPDLATCPACLAEVLSPPDRRHGYPFTNCTHCGPRFSIVRSLPYDRPRTTMAGFKMCAACRREYESPLDRRFHAQPNACPDCGPHLELWDAAGRVRAERGEALRGAVQALVQGRVVALKGLGGFLLTADARSPAAVRRLRERKPRRDKPLALMVCDVEQARTLCAIDEPQAAALRSPEAPILLLRRRPDAPVAEEVAPDNPYLGLMLPYTPLHHLLLRESGFPLVATSGNLSEEPICTDERDALDKLGGIADDFLVHDRPIARHVDDSIAWFLDGRTRVLRRARGFAPRPVLLRREVPAILAVGAHLKNAAALSVGSSVFVSQHIGDMESPEAARAFERVIADFLHLYDSRPAAIAHDLHPDYVTTRWALDAVGGDGTLGALPTIAVQHHHAHLASCLADNDVEGPALGVTWDGTGYGADGTVWGGEFLLGSAASFERVASLAAFRLPGGEAAVREPRRSAVSLLWQTFGERALEMDDLSPVRAFRPAERAPLGAMLARGVRSPWTTSAGRLFDGLAALTGLVQKTTFEGQAAMALEFAADADVRDGYPIELERRDDAPRTVVDWRPLVQAAVDDVRRGRRAGLVSARFHNALVEAVVRVAQEMGRRRVALSGGCFQNRRLTEGCLERLRAEGFEVLLHRRVPPGDGGISLGQVAVAAARLRASGVS